jgi:hypothetical protein
MLKGIKKFINSDWCVFIIFCILSTIFTFPIFYNINNWGIEDWDYTFFNHAVPRTTILEYNQIPLWNPYSNGGQSMLAFPESRVLSPFFSFVLLFGEVIGIKLLIWLFLIIGLFGMYKLSKYYKLDSIVAFLPPFVFLLSSMYPLILTSGMPNLMQIVLIPWAFLFYLKSFQNLKYALVSSLFLVLMLFDGGIYPFIFSLTFIGLYSFLLMFNKRSEAINAGKIFFIIFIFTLCLGAVKLFPMIEFLNKYPRRTDALTGYSLNSLYYSLFNRDQSIGTDWGIRAFDENMTTGEKFINSMSYAMDENGMYIGIIPFILFLVGFAFYFKRRKILALSFIIFLWLGFGKTIPISLWEWLHKLPVYDSLLVSQRFRFIFMLCLAMFSGFGFQNVKNYLSKKITNKQLIQFSMLIILLIILIDLAIVNLPAFKDAFPIPPLSITKSVEFYHVSIFPLYDKNGWLNNSQGHTYSSYGSSYVAFLSNIGITSAYQSIDVHNYSVPVDSPYYKGEVYLIDTEGDIHIRNWSPNKIIIDFNVSREGYLIINQNYYNGWKAMGAREYIVEPMNGLLSVKIPASEKEIELYYLPSSFIIGLVVTLLTSFIFLALYIAQNLSLKYRK